MGVIELKIPIIFGVGKSKVKVTITYNIENLNWR